MHPICLKTLSRKLDGALAMLEEPLMLPGDTRHWDVVAFLEAVQSLAVRIEELNGGEKPIVEITDRELQIAADCLLAEAEQARRDGAA